MSWLTKLSMFIHGNGDHLVAYRGHIFLIDPNSDLDDSIIIEMSRILGIDSQSFDDIYDYLNHISESRPDILQGQLENSVLTLQSKSFQHGIGSSLLKHVTESLGIHQIEYWNSGSKYRDYNSSEISGSLPNYLFHGTTSSYANAILRFGLQPGKSDTNYPSIGIHDEINHPEIVFLTEDLDRASYHAINAVSRQKNGFPIIFQFMIPNKNLLVWDYDIEVMYDEEFSGNIYNNTYKAPNNEFSARIKENPYKFSKKSGLFGYRGRIPSSFIIDIKIRPEEKDTYYFNNKEWTSITFDQLRVALDFNDPMMYDFDDEDRREWS